MKITSRAGLTVELPDEQFMGKEKTLTLAGRIYKARKWMESLSVRDSIERIMDLANATRRDLGIPERPQGMSVADDPHRSLEDITESDFTWISGIAAWYPDWRITAPVTWGMH